MFWSKTKQISTLLWHNNGEISDAGSGILGIYLIY